MTLYWFGYEWKFENETAACGSTFYGINSGKISYENYEAIVEKIKKEVYDQNLTVSLLAEGPFITSVYRVDYDSKLFRGEETAFAISYVANTENGESRRAQICIKILLRFKNFTNTTENLTIAFSCFLKEIRKKAEELSGEKFESFQVFYIHELG